MQRVCEEKGKKIYVLLTALGIVSICIFCMAWCCSTLYYKEKIPSFLFLLGNAAAIVSYCFCVEKIVYVYKRSCLSEKNFFQVKIINLLVLILFGGMLLGDIKLQDKNWFYILSDVIWFFLCLYLGLKNNFVFKGIVCKVCESIRRDWLFWGLLLIALCLAIEPGKIQVRWDGAFYESECRNVMNIHSLSTLGAVGHMSQAFGVLYCLIFNVVENSELSLAILNVLFYLGSILGFFYLIKLIFPDFGEITYVLGTAVYAFSPFSLGMVNYYSLDYMPMCLFVWVIYFAYKRYWILHMITACCFVFTKEPLIIAYAGVCIGILVMDWEQSKYASYKEKIRDFLGKLQYYLMVLVGLIWVGIFLMFCGWGGSGSFGIDIGYMIEKLKVLFVLNFNWLLCGVIALEVIYILLTKRMKEIDGRWCVPLVLSLVLFIIFNMAYITINHARYSAVVPVIIYLLSLGFASIALKEKWVRLGSGIVVIILLLTSYKTIDPVSLSVFEKIETGKTTMITTSTPMIGDMMIYNKQMLAEEDALNRALEYALEEGAMIFVPTYENSTYYFDGSMIEPKEKEGYYEVEAWWNEKKKRREVYEKENCRKLVLNEIYGNTSDVVQLALQKEKKICYIYAPWLGQDQAAELEQKWNNTNTIQFEKGDWVISALLIEKE